MLVIVLDVGKIRVIFLKSWKLRLVIACVVSLRCQGHGRERCPREGAERAQKSVRHHGGPGDHLQTLIRLVRQARETPSPTPSLSLHGTSCTRVLQCTEASTVPCPLLGGSRVPMSRCEHLSSPVSGPGGSPCSAVQGSFVAGPQTTHYQVLCCRTCATEQIKKVQFPVQTHDPKLI